MCKIKKWILWTHFIYWNRERYPGSLLARKVNESYSRPVYFENSNVWILLRKQRRRIFPPLTWIEKGRLFKLLLSKRMVKIEEFTKLLLFLSLSPLDRVHLTQSFFTETFYIACNLSNYDFHKYTFLRVLSPIHPHTFLASHSTFTWLIQ